MGQVPIDTLEWAYWIVSIREKPLGRPQGTEENKCNKKMHKKSHVENMAMPDRPVAEYTKVHREYSLSFKRVTLGNEKFRGETSMKGIQR